jgi:YD repeat-containing protein
LLVSMYSTTDRSGDAATRTFYQYDWLDRITQITYPTVNGLTLTETIEYDHVDLGLHLVRTRRTDVNGVVHDTWTDENDRVVKIIRDGVTIEEREYDVMGNLHKVTDARGNITRHWYDAIDRQIATEYHWIVPDNPSAQNPGEVFDYYPDGRLLASTDANDNTTVLIYDAIGRLTRKEYNDGTATDLTYDGSGNRIATITENSETVSYTYDNRHRVISIGSSLHDWTMDYTYNAGDQVTSVIGGDGLTTLYDVTYQYYEDGSLSRLDDGINQGRFDFDYALNGLRRTFTRPNSVRTQYEYDVLGRSVSITHLDSRDQELQRFDYTYDIDTIDGTGNPVYKGLRTKRIGMTGRTWSIGQRHGQRHGQGLSFSKY